MSEFDRAHAEWTVAELSDTERTFAAATMQSCLDEIDRLKAELTDREQRLQGVIRHSSEIAEQNVKLELKCLEQEVDRLPDDAEVREAEQRGYRQGLEAAAKAAESLSAHWFIFPNPEMDIALFRDIKRQIAKDILALMDDKRAAEPHLAPPQETEAT